MNYFSNERIWVNRIWLTSFTTRFPNEWKEIGKKYNVYLII
jgi:hypothetical protein